MHDGHSMDLVSEIDDPPYPRSHIIRPFRKKTLLKGKLIHNDGAYTHDCMIRDISAGGAKISLTEHESLPADVYLLVVKHGVAYQAKVVWTKFPARGLQFADSFHLLSARLPEELKYLRRLWVDLSVRSGIWTA